MEEVESVKVPPVAIRTTRATRPQTGFALSMPEVPLVFRNFLVGSNGRTKVVRRWAESHHASPDWPKGSPLVTDDVLMALELGIELGDPIVKRAIGDDQVNPLLCLDYQSNLTPSYRLPSTTLYLKAHGYKVSDLRAETSPFSGVVTKGFLVKVIHLDQFHVYVRDYNMRVESSLGSMGPPAHSNVHRLDLISKVDTARMWGQPYTAASDEESLRDIIFDIKGMFEECSDTIPF
jgi:hypothetical protein